MNVVMLGATKGMGRSLARLMAERGDRIYLLGRNESDLDKSAQDLKIHGAAASDGPMWGVCDLANTDHFDQALADAQTRLGKIDAVVITAGLFALQEDLEADLDRAQSLLDVNFTKTIIFCEKARRILLEGGGGTLCVFSSVAGVRGRKPVAIYGASKAGLSHYLESLDHKFRADGLVTVCVHPGFVKTGMTEGLDAPPFAGEPDQVARIVLKAIDKGKPLVYAPGMWRWIMTVISCLPRFVMRKINF